MSPLEIAAEVLRAVVDLAIKLVGRENTKAMLDEQVVLLTNMAADVAEAKLPKE